MVGKERFAHLGITSGRCLFCQQRYAFRDVGGGLVSGVNQGMNQLLRIQPPELFFFFGKVLCFCVFVLKR